MLPVEDANDSLPESGIQRRASEINRGVYVLYSSSSLMGEEEGLE
jgi:hypothetical protein